MHSHIHSIFLGTLMPLLVQKHINTSGSFRSHIQHGTKQLSAASRYSALMSLVVPFLCASKLIHPPQITSACCVTCWGKEFSWSVSNCLITSEMYNIAACWENYEPWVTPLNVHHTGTAISVLLPIMPHSHCYCKMAYSCMSCWASSNRNEAT